MSSEPKALASIRAATARVPTKSTRENVTSGSSTFVVIKETPASLATKAGVSLDVYSLARMVMSEDGSANAETLLCLAESTRNYARSTGVSITTLLTRSSKAVAAGKYSEQAAGKWASTRLDPSERCLVAARVAIEDNTDFCDGAVDFFDPRAQDKGVQGTHSLSLTSEAYIERAAGRKLEWVGPLPGIDPYRLMLFRFANGSINLDAAYAVLQKGRGLAKSSLPILALAVSIFYFWRMS